MASLAQGSPVQGILFYGIEGSGKERLALVLAQAWLCVRNTEGGACGECQACKAFERGRCADYLEISPAGASKVIRIGAITEVSPSDEDYPVPAQTFLRTPPLSAHAKVVVIHEAERLNPRAANSLLKTLEEPPPYGRFILLTDTVGSILPTILSRCVAVACEVPATLEGYPEWAVRLANGAPERAKELEEHGAAYLPIYEFAMAMPGRPIAEGLIAAEQFASLAERLQGVKKSGARAANAEALEVLAAAYAMAPNRRPEALQAIVECHRRVLGNANAGSSFDALFTAALGS